LNSVGFDCESACIWLKNCPGEEMAAVAAAAAGGTLLALVVDVSTALTLDVGVLATLPKRLLMFIEGLLGAGAESGARPFTLSNGAGFGRVE
jgi:hypothetical protein